MKQELDVSIFSSVNNSYNSQLSPSISLITFSLYFSLSRSTFFLHFLILIISNFSLHILSLLCLYFLTPLSVSNFSLNSLSVRSTFSPLSLSSAPLLSRSTVYYFLTVVSLSTPPIYSPPFLFCLFHFILYLLSTLSTSIVWLLLSHLNSYSY